MEIPYGLSSYLMEKLITHKVSFLFISVKQVALFSNSIHRDHYLIITYIIKECYNKIKTLFRSL